MPVAQLNNVPTQNNYVDVLTVEFSHPRAGFSVQVFNAAVYYQVGVISPAGRGTDWESLEHFMAPSYAMFRDPTSEGFAPNTKFAGIRFRSAVTNTPGNVSVA